MPLKSGGPDRRGDGSGASKSEQIKNHHNNNARGEKQQESRAKHLTIAAGGSWCGTIGRLSCPVCERHQLIIEDGDRAVIVSCIGHCDRRVIVTVLRARGWWR